MAATILNSPRATEVSVYIVRAFVRLRETLASHELLAAKLEELERKTEALALRPQRIPPRTQLHIALKPRDVFNFGFGDAVSQTRRKTGGVTNDSHVHWIVLADRTGIELDLNDLRVLRYDIMSVKRRVKAQPRAEREYHVGLVHKLTRDRISIRRRTCIAAK